MSIDTKLLESLLNSEIKRKQRVNFTQEHIAIAKKCRDADLSIRATGRILYELGFAMSRGRLERLVKLAEAGGGARAK